MFIVLQPVEAGDDAFWDQFWADTVTNVSDVFALIPAAEIRALREESPSNLATLCYKVFSIHLLLIALLSYLSHSTIAFSKTMVNKLVRCVVLPMAQSNFPFS